MTAEKPYEQLAILGGSPSFPEKLHVGRPNVGNRERLMERINDLLDARWLTNDGPYVHELEQRIADMTGVRHCIAVCNATVALEIVSRAAGLAGEVIVPSFTFIATAHALQWQQITPVFCDVAPGSHNIDPAQVERLITPRTTGIMGVHVWGKPCDVDALAEIAARHQLKLIFDAAHALGCSHRGRMIGTFGDAEVFSFHATKFVNSFEGGAIVTNDDRLAAKIRLMKNFGFAGYDRVVSVGTNGKMSEISAAMGLTSLEDLPSFVAVNQANHDLYRRHLQGVAGITMLPFGEGEQSNYQYVVLEVDAAGAGITRDQLMDVLWAENVLARRYFFPGCHNMEPYRSRDPRAGRRLPQTERLMRRVLVLPTGTSVGADEIARICAVIRTAVAHSPEIRAAIRARGPRK